MNSFFIKIKSFLRKYFFNDKWTCNACGKEVFNNKYFCDECEDKLPFIVGAKCQHCGRKTIAYEIYCTTCKNIIVDVDLGRSVFSYSEPISRLLRNFKYNNKQYLADLFGEYLATEYFKNYFRADVIAYVPMTKKATRKRGYNQSMLLAKVLSEKTNLPLVDVVIKKRETERQAKLNRAERLKSLRDAFKVSEKDAVKDKEVLIVDDVTTTGATAQAIAEVLKKAKAKKVYLLTVASVPPIDGY